MKIYARIFAVSILATFVLHMCGVLSLAAAVMIPFVAPAVVIGAYLVAFEIAGNRWP